MEENKLSSATAKMYREHFEERWSNFGRDVRTLWGSRESQEQRFKVLSELGEFNGKIILDVGCGFGDFLRFLKTRNIRPTKYIGCDLVPDFLNVAKEMAPEAQFINGDLLSLTESAPPHVDYAIASGIFFLPHQNWEQYVKETVNKMFALSKYGVAVNFLSALSESKDTVSYYSEPGSCLKLMMSITPMVVLRHDYRRNDFTVYLYKGNQA